MRLARPSAAGGFSTCTKVQQGAEAGPRASLPFLLDGVLCESPRDAGGKAVHNSRQATDNVRAFADPNVDE